MRTEICGPKLADRILRTVNKNQENKINNELIKNFQNLYWGVFMGAESESDVKFSKFSRKIYDFENHLIFCQIIDFFK